jgi:hypothetical protein
MSLKIQTEDGYIFKKDSVLVYLYECLQNDTPAEIDLNLEGNCADSMGLYELLDRFCNCTGYPKHKITVVTGNMVEQHPDYQIRRDPGYWFEIPQIKQWAQENTFKLGNQPLKHFGSFVGQSRWPRLWISAWLWKNHQSRTLMTFHSGFKSNYRTNAQDGVYDWLGLEQLNQYDCDIIPTVGEFLAQCPFTIKDDLCVVRNTNIRFDQPTYYPLQHPTNLNIIAYYEDIFVDIINETSVTGQAFFATEKLWRCILARRPFVTVANQNYLHHLRSLGFKTFDNWWSEDYDYQSNQIRIHELQTVINSIAQWSVDRLANTLEQMQPVLEHNYQTFLKLNPQQLLEVLDV